MKQYDPTNENSLLSVTQAAEWLSITIDDVHELERQGLLLPNRTVGGHRRFPLWQLVKYREKETADTRERIDRQIELLMEQKERLAT